MREKDYPFIEAGIYVISETKRDKIMDILSHPNPGHEERLWMIGFLDGIGCTKHEIWALIEKNNQWIDFDEVRTKRHIDSLRRAHDNTFTALIQYLGDQLP